MCEREAQGLGMKRPCDPGSNPGGAKFYFEVSEMMEVGFKSGFTPGMGVEFGFGVEVGKSRQDVKKPICFVVRNKKSGHEYEVWYFENLDLLVKNSVNGNHNDEYQPDIDSFKAIGKGVFKAILNSDEFEVV